MAYFRAIASARLAMDTADPEGTNLGGHTDDEEAGLPEELVAAIMSHARQTYDEETCAKLAKHFGLASDEEGVTYGPPNFRGQPKTALGHRARTIGRGRGQQLRALVGDGAPHQLDAVVLPWRGCATSGL